jgi:RNA polymerase sigma factor (sigma-70 family)
MECLNSREIKIVNMHVKEDLTFQQISQQMGISESQISRIYKKSIEKVRKQIKSD